MAEKKKAKEKVVGDAPSRPASAPEQVIIIHFTSGQPRLETNGDLQVWHFMVATALLKQVTLQDVLLGTMQRSKALDATRKPQQAHQRLVLPS